MFQTKVVEKIKTYFVFNNFFEYHAVYEIMWEDTGGGQVADDNMAHSYCLLNT